MKELHKTFIPKGGNLGGHLRIIIISIALIINILK